MLSLFYTRLMKENTEQQGKALLEFALFLPVIVAMIAFLIEAGATMRTVQRVSQTGREAALTAFQLVTIRQDAASVASTVLDTPGGLTLVNQQYNDAFSGSVGAGQPIGQDAEVLIEEAAKSNIEDFFTDGGSILISFYVLVNGEFNRVATKVIKDPATAMPSSRLEPDYDAGTFHGNPIPTNVFDKITVAEVFYEREPIFTNISRIEGGIGISTPFREIYQRTTL